MKNNILIFILLLSPFFSKGQKADFPGEAEKYIFLYNQNDVTIDFYFTLNNVSVKSARAKPKEQISYNYNQMWIWFPGGTEKYYLKRAGYYHIVWDSNKNIWKVKG